jgi:dephospho-CoA kinase
MKRDALPGEQAQARMDTQMTQDEKRRFASVVIDNSGDLEQTRMQVELLFKRLKQSAF